MQYHITEQYSHTTEHLTAELGHLNNVQLFLNQKLFHTDNVPPRSCIYRIYDNGKLVQRLCADNIPFEYTNDMEGDYAGADLTQYFFSVKAQNEIIATFKDKNDAHLFIMAKSEQLSVFKGPYLVEKNDIIEHSYPEEKYKIFDPTPLQTKLVPPGFPRENWRDDEENSK